MNSAMRKFAEIVDDLGLMDLPLQGGEFTWNGDKTIRSGQDWTGSLFPLVGLTNTMGLVNAGCPVRSPIISQLC
ncbi:hypothetical protein CK203_008183 [Vitis vinifera]|uniref:Uncharacterized protein n=1 Tax=Vitis vinifera TaxID=29760 RepID=A0A438KP56_VITVI|nr:hypothetical protein CK203_008183 [Vitis vinifera]